MYGCFNFYIATTLLGSVSAADQDVCTDPEGANPNPADCGSYYQCTKGLPTLVKCPDYRVFDEKTKYCVLDHIGQSQCSEGKKILHFF